MPIAVKITVDPDRLLFGDLEILEQASAGGGMKVEGVAGGVAVPVTA